MVARSRRVGVRPKRRSFLQLEFDTKSYGLRREAGAAIQEHRAARTGGETKGGAGAGVELIASPVNLAPVQVIIADGRSDPLGEIVTELDSDFRRICELRAAKRATIRLLGEDADTRR